MYQIFKSWISFFTEGGTGSYSSGLSLSNQEQYLLMGTIIISVLMIAFFGDLIYRLIRSFIRK